MFDPSKEYEDFRRRADRALPASKRSEEEQPPAFLSSPARQACHGKRAQEPPDNALKERRCDRDHGGGGSDPGNPRDSLILVISSSKWKASGFQKNLLPFAPGVLRWPFRYSALGLLTAMATGVQKEAVGGVF